MEELLAAISLVGLAGISILAYIHSCRKK